MKLYNTADAAKKLNISPVKLRATAIDLGVGRKTSPVNGRWFFTQKDLEAIKNSVTGGDWLNISELIDPESPGLSEMLDEYNYANGKALTPLRLHEMSGVSPERVYQLMAGNYNGMSVQTLAKVFGCLGIDLKISW